jgi:hypothetical protein
MLLLVWVSPQPFQSLADAPATTSDGGNRVNQIVFTLAFLTLGGGAWLNGIAAIIRLTKNDGIGCARSCRPQQVQ